MLKIMGRIRASAALKKAYYRKLMKLIDDMSSSVKWWLEAEYKRQESQILAADSATGEINAALQTLFSRWSKNFDKAARDIATWFVNESGKHSNRNLQKTLIDAGFTVKLKLTAAQRVKLEALVLENVNLIKSIERIYFTQLTTLTMESVSRGRDLGYLREEIEKRYGVARDRAVLIARDQNNKATSIITHAKYEELGITQAVWKHNSGAKTPRASHLAADDKVYDIQKGMFIDGKHIFPGEEINCGCTSVPIIPELKEINDERVEPSRPSGSKRQITDERAESSSHIGYKRQISDRQQQAF